MRLSELKVGQVIVADSGFTCIAPGERCEVMAMDGELAVRCSDGFHFLCGQVAGPDDDTIVGFELAK